MDEPTPGAEGGAPGRELWLFRHGETEWSVRGKHTGRTDLHLTPEGRRRAAALGRALAARPFVLVLTSPLTRAVETCQLAGYGHVARPTPDLVEWDYGEYEGRTTMEILKENPRWSLWTDGVPGGESLEHVADRVGRVIRLALGAAGDVALFAHGHVLRVLAASWLGLPADVGRMFELGTAAVSTLGSRRGVHVVVRWNQDGHLVGRAP